MAINKVSTTASLPKAAPKKEGKEETQAIASQSSQTLVADASIAKDANGALKAERKSSFELKPGITLNSDGSSRVELKKLQGVPAIEVDPNRANMQGVTQNNPILRGIKAVSNAAEEVSNFVKDAID
jgi:hypothetical protein